MQNLRGMQDLTPMIEPGEYPNWWVDGSYAVHPDMWSHSGIYMTLGKGIICSGLFKQKPNTKNSTEAEPIAIDNAMGQILWTRNFLPHKGEYVQKTTITKTIKSFILLAENGKTLSSKSMRHLNVRYYFVTDQINKGHIKVLLCPMQNMLAEFFIKPLQGALFICMCEKS